MTHKYLNHLKKKVIPDNHYIEIFFDGKEFDLQIRWCGDGEQHIAHNFDTFDEVSDRIREYYESGE